MNIAIDLRPLLTDRDTGVTVYTRELVHAMLKQDSEHQFFLFINSYNREQKAKIAGEFEQYPQAQVIAYNYPNKFLNTLLSFFRYPKLDTLISKQAGESIDVFFFPDPRPAPVSKKCKKVMTFHDLSFSHYKQTFSVKTRLWHRFFLRPKKEAKSCCNIIAVSYATKKDLMKTYNIDSQKIRVCYEGVTEEFKSITEVKKLKEVQTKYQLPEHFFLSLSTLEPRKNLKRLIKAFCIWKEEHPQSFQKLVIAGCSDKNVFVSKQLSIPEEVRSDIVFTGYVDTQDKPALYSLADALCFISLYEGFGLPIIEAMACGTPVMTSNCSSMKEVAAHSAALVDPLSIDEMCNGFTKILRAKNIFQKKGKKRAQFFNWNVSAQKILKIFENT